MYSRDSHQPINKHSEAVKRLFKYLARTNRLGIVYGQANDKISINCFSDADWGSDHETRQSTSDGVILIGGGPVMFYSRRQKAVAFSSAEAEYILASEAVKDISWLTQLLNEIGISHDRLQLILTTSQPSDRLESKHVDVR